MSFVMWLNVIPRLHQVVALHSHKKSYILVGCVVHCTGCITVTLTFVVLYLYSLHVIFVATNESQATNHNAQMGSPRCTVRVKVYIINIYLVNAGLSKIAKSWLTCLTCLYQIAPCVLFVSMFSAGTFSYVYNILCWLEISTQRRNWRDILGLELF